MERERTQDDRPTGDGSSQEFIDITSEVPETDEVLATIDAVLAKTTKKQRWGLLQDGIQRRCGC